MPCSVSTSGSRAWRSPELRYLYYGLCLPCALACWQGCYSALIGTAESSVNLLILLAGDTTSSAGINGYNGVNFPLTGAILLAVFYSAQEALRNTSGTYRSRAAQSTGVRERNIMGILDKLFGRRERRATPLDEARTLIERFTTATLAGVDPEDIGRYPAKQRQAMAFHFGAIQHLADEYALDETRTLGLFVMFVNRYFNLPVSETGSISQLLEGFQSNPREREFLEAGVQAFRRWHLQNDRRAPLDLGEMLNHT